MPEISVITTSYNYGKYISQTIESVISQTFQDWEMLIIDDGSTDNSVEIIDEYVKKDNRIRLYCHLNKKNKGLIETLKLGISQAKGKYIVFLESDDYLAPDNLEKKLKIFNTDETIGLVYSDIELFGAKAKPRRKLYFYLLRRYWAKNNYPHNMSDILHFKNDIPTFSCVMIKRDLLNDLNWNAPDVAAIDWWLWSQIAPKINIFYINEKLTFWRLHKDSYLNKSRDISTDKLMEFMEGVYNFLPPIKSLKYKLLFILKLIISSMKYKRNLLPNIKYIFKKRT